LPGRLTDAEGRVRFLVEAEMVARLRHPNLVQIYSLGENDGRPYFEMEYIEGGSLLRRLDGTPWLPVSAAQMVAVLARAIGQAHRLGIIHRDLKPANVLLTNDDSPKVVDFGLAKSLDADPNLTQSGVFVGTPSYAAPEQVAGSPHAVGPGADIYALGAILYHMLTGRPPFHAPTVLQTLEHVKSAEPVPPSRLQPGLPRDVETIALKCLEKDPRRRYADAAALAEDLDRFLGGRPILARPIRPAERAQRWIRRRPAVALLSTAVVALTILGFILVGWQWRRAEAKAVKEAAANEVAQRARLDAYQDQAELTFHQALALCDQGEVGRGLAWIARSLELATSARSDCLDRPIRINLADWTSQLIHRCRVPSMKHRAPVLALAFGHDGKALVSVGSDGVVRFWNTATGRESGLPLDFKRPPAFARFERARAGPEAERQRGSTPIALSSGDNMLARVAPDRQSTTWVAPTGNPLDAERLDGSSVEVSALTPDGRTVITGTRGGRLHVWDNVSQRGFDLPPQGTDVTTLAVSPDSRVFASGTQGGVVRLWDSSLLGPIGQTCKFASGVTAIAFDTHGRVLAIGDEDGTIRLWNLPRPKSLGPPLRVDGPVQTVSYSRGGARLLIGTPEGVQWWDLTGGISGKSCQKRDGRRDDSQSSRVAAVTVSLDGRLMARAMRLPAGGPCRGRIELRDVIAGTSLRQTPDQPHRITGLAFSPDARSLLTWGPDCDSASLWDVANLRDSRPLFRCLNSPILQAEFSRDGRSVILGCRDGKARLWDLHADVEINSDRRPRHAYPITAVAFDNDRSRLVTGCHAGTVRFWDLTRGTMLNELRANAGEIVVLALSPDRTMIATASRDGTARFLDAESGRQLGPALHHTDAVLCIAFHPDGRSIVTGTRDGMVQRWSAPAPPEIGAPAELARRVSALTGIELTGRRAEMMTSVVD
jgi:WD40 repeat protein